MIAPLRTISRVLAAAAIVLVARAAWIQVVRPDTFASAAGLAEQADGGLRFEYNPRLVDSARVITRGTIYDRNGLPLATSRADEMSSSADKYRAAQVSSVDRCPGSEPRCYPLGPQAFHVVGEFTRQTNWAARNTSYVERDADVELKGFDDRATVVVVRNRRTGKTERIVKRSYVELLPLLRNRHRPDAPAVRAILDRPRDVTISIDARLQARAAAAIRNRVEARQAHPRGSRRDGRRVGRSARLGQLSVAGRRGPRWRRPRRMRRHSSIVRATGFIRRGPTFKLVVAAAALRAAPVARPNR